MPIYEAADKALKTFQEEFMPVETFSEFLDAAGQCSFLLERFSGAEPEFASGAGRCLHLHRAEVGGRTLTAQTAHWPGVWDLLLEAGASL